MKFHYNIIKRFMKLSFERMVICHEKIRQANDERRRQSGRCFPRDGFQSNQ